MMRMEREDQRHRDTMGMEQMRMGAEAERFDKETALKREEGQASRGMEMHKLAVSGEAQQAQKLETLTAPLQEQFSAVADGLQQVMATVQEINAQAQQAAARLDELAEQATAPREIVRGPDGRAAGVKIGNRVRQIARGADGRATGLQ